MVKGVIFDFDGVIVDSVNQLFNAYWDILSDLKVTVVSRNIDHLNGLKITEICEDIILKYKVKTTLYELVALYDSKLDHIYETCDEIQPIIKLIKQLKLENIPMSVASGCPEKFIKKVLKRLEIDSYFDCLVGAESISKGKPNPEVFEACLKHSSFERALIIDDSNSGVLGALRSGCIALKFDEAILACQSLFEIVSHHLGNELSYLGEFSKFEINFHEEDYQLTDVELNKWKDLEKLGSYNSPVLLLDISGTNGFNSVNAIKRDYRYYRVKNHSDIALAVTGVVMNDQGQILIGKRSSSNFQYPEKYDLIPAGGLEDKDYINQLNTEWHEETNSTEIVSWSDNSMLFIDHLNNVLDVVVKGVVNNIEPGECYSSEFDSFSWGGAEHFNALTPLAETFLKYKMASI